MSKTPDVTEAHDHLVTVDTDQMMVVLKRITGDGPAVLYTKIDLPSANPSKDEIDRFCKKLGEAIILDSAPLRKMYGSW